MADGTFAVLLIVLGLADMNSNYCGTSQGCLARSEGVPRIGIAAGEVVKRRAKPAAETYLRYDLGANHGPFGQAVGLSTGEKGETWLGYGLTYKMSFGWLPLYAELHLMPGLYFDSGGFDLGGLIAFRSGIEIGWEGRQGWRIAAGYDHRSHAGIYPKNPGIETVHIRVAAPSR